MFGFEGTEFVLLNSCKAQWLSWLERRPVTAKVVGPSPIWVVFSQNNCGIYYYIMWDLSSAGRASALQAEGHRFEPCRSHCFANIANLIRRCGSIGRAADL